MVKQTHWKTNWINFNDFIWKGEREKETRYNKFNVRELCVPVEREGNPFKLTCEIRQTE